MFFLLSGGFFAFIAPLIVYHVQLVSRGQVRTELAYLHLELNTDYLVLTILPSSNTVAHLADLCALKIRIAGGYVTTLTLLSFFFNPVRCCTVLSNP